MDEIHVAPNGDDFHGFIPDVQVENRLVGCHHVPKRGGDLDEGVIALVVQAC